MTTKKNRVVYSWRDKSVDVMEGDKILITVLTADINPRKRTYFRTLETEDMTMSESQAEAIFYRNKDEIDGLIFGGAQWVEHKKQSITRWLND